MNVLLFFSLPFFFFSLFFFPPSDAVFHGALMYTLLIHYQCCQCGVQCGWRTPLRGWENKKLPGTGEFEDEEQLEEDNEEENTAGPRVIVFPEEASRVCEQWRASLRRVLGSSLILVWVSVCRAGVRE